MYGVVATTADWPIIREIANLLGALMNLLYDGLSAIGMYNVGVTVIIFTIILLNLMLPLTIKQQRGMRIQQVMQPDIQKITKKYAGKKDQASRMKQQEEIGQLQRKYGASPFSSCLPMLATMPILIALFPVVQNIPRYVEGVRRVYSPLVEKIEEIPESIEILQRIGEDLPLGLGNLDFTQSSDIYTLLARLQEHNWQTLKEYLPSLEYVIANTMDQLHSINTFLGISVSENPFNMLAASFAEGNFVGVAVASVIPVLSGATQFLSVKLQPTPAADPDNPIARQMRMMIYFMPIFSVFLGFTLPAGLGIYWATSGMVRGVQMLFINRSLNKKGTEALIEENLAKAEKRQARKKTTSPSALNTMATKATRSIEESKSTGGAGNKESSNQTNVAYTGGGSLADRANMVRRYNAGKTTNEDNKGKKAKK
jgi:YidC/Oxa1 family membrane protein insertase